MAARPVNGVGGIKDDSEEINTEYENAADIFDALEGGTYGAENEAIEESESVAEDTAVEFSEEDMDGEEASLEEQLEQGDITPQEYAKLKIKADKREVEFSLDPENEELIKTLQFGVAGRRAFSERDKALAEAKRLKERLTDYDAVKSKADTMNDIMSLVERGYTEQAVKALLGEKYSDFKRHEILNTIDYENATPEERYQMDMDRSKREQEWTEYQKNKRIEELERRLEEKESALEEDKWHNIGMQLLDKYSMANYTKDADVAEEQNEMIWEATWNEMAKLPDDVEWTPSMLEKVMRRKAKVFRAGLSTAVEDRLTKATEAKKEAAKSQAQMAARRGEASQPQGGLADRLRGAKTNIDRLNILMGR